MLVTELIMMRYKKILRTKPAQLETAMLQQHRQQALLRQHYRPHRLSLPRRQYQLRPRKRRNHRLPLLHQAVLTDSLPAWPLPRQRMQPGSETQAMQ